jgi:pyrophosphatase PpaX
MQVVNMVMNSSVYRKNIKSLFPPETPLRAVLWDIDGTLIDTTALIVDVLHSMFLHFTQKEMSRTDLRSLIGIPLEKQVCFLGDPSQFGASVSEMRDFAVRRYERRRDLERLIPESIDALIRMKRVSISTALVTSKNDVELCNSLPRLGISPYCDAIIGSDQSAPYHKPHPRPVEIALRKMKIDNPQHAIFIGDSIYDMQSAKSAGVRTAAVLWGASTEEMLVREQPDIIFSKPEEIAQAFLD